MMWRADRACGFGDLGKRRYGIATVGLSSTLFKRGAPCGGYYEVKCVENLKYCTSIVIMTTNFYTPNYDLPADAGGMTKKMHGVVWKSWATGRDQSPKQHGTKRMASEVAGQRCGAIKSE
jgi:hypothetical protein